MERDEADTTGIYGDAFKDDLKDEEAKGQALTEEHAFISVAGTLDPQQQKQLLAESKCNNVSFMKLEPLPSDCRSVLAVSDAYICYAVTQKRNLLRVIDSQTGEKSLLRGHQHCVTDLSFSPVDVHCICSVDAADGAPPIGADAGAGGAADHVFFWRKAAEGEWERRASLPLQAHRTVPHPARSNWWALLSHSGSSSDSGNSSVCVVDVDALASGDAAGSTLKMQLSAGERATDVAFSSDGAQLVVGIASRSSSGASSHRVQLYSFVPSLVGKAATDTDESSMGRRQLVPVYSASQATQMVLATGPESALLGLQCLPQDHLLTVTSSCSRSAGIGGASDSATAVSYVLTVWRCPFSQISAAAARDAGASTRMYPLPYVVQSLTLDLPRFSGGSGGSGSDGGGALSMHDCALCLEPRRQRYVVLTSRRSPLAACIAVALALGAGAAPMHESARVLDHVTFLNVHAPVLSADAITVLGQQHHSAEAGEHIELSCYQEAAAADRSQSSIQQYFSLLAHTLPSTTRNQRIAAPPAAAAADVQPNSQLNFGAESVSLAELLAGKKRQQKQQQQQESITVDAQPQAAKAGWSILSILSRHNTSSAIPATTAVTATPAITTAAAAAAAEGGLPATLPSPGIVPVPKAAPVSVSAIPSPSADSGSRASRSILETLRAGGSFTNSPPIPAPAPTVSAAATPASFLRQTSSRNQSARDMLSSASSTPLKGAAATTTATAATAAAAAAASASKPPDAASLPVAGCEDIQQGADSDFKASNAAAECDVPPAIDGSAAVTSQQLKQQQMQQIQAAVKAAVEQSFFGSSSRSRNGKSTATPAAKDSSAAVERIAADVGALVEATLEKQVLPRLSVQLEQSLKQQLKAQLQSVVKQQFEGAVVPALQAGMQQMFQQTDAACQAGLAAVRQQGAELLAQKSRENIELRQELTELRSGMQAMRAQLETMEQMLASMQAQQQQQVEQRASAAAEPVEDAMSLLKKGQVPEAVMRALEQKDVASIVEVLAQLTPAVVNGKCSPLVRLCITQQLAADMSERIPQEGVGRRVEWIKNLVLSLLSSSVSTGNAEEDAHFAAHFKGMIAAVLESIQAARHIILKAAVDDGDDVDASSAVPPSVGTDLQMLELILRTKV